MKNLFFYILFTTIAFHTSHMCLHPSGTCPQSALSLVRKQSHSRKSSKYSSPNPHTLNILQTDSLDPQQRTFRDIGASREQPLKIARVTTKIFEKDGSVHLQSTCYSAARYTEKLLSNLASNDNDGKYGLDPVTGHPILQLDFFYTDRLPNTPEARYWAKHLGRITNDDLATEHNNITYLLSSVVQPIKPQKCRTVRFIRSKL